LGWFPDILALCHQSQYYGERRDKTEPFSKHEFYNKLEVDNIVVICLKTGPQMIRSLIAITLLLSVSLSSSCASSSDTKKENIEQYLAYTIVPLFETERSITDERRIILHTFTSYSRNDFFIIFDDIAQRAEQLYKDYQEAARNAPSSLFNAMKKLKQSSELVVQADAIYSNAFNQTDITLLNQYVDEGNALIASSQQLEQEAENELIDACSYYGIDIYEYYNVSKDLEEEFQYIQTAVEEMIVASRRPGLDAIYDEIAELAEVQNVTAGDGAYKLDDYIFGYVYPLMQAYDISQDGEVTVD
jgi:hypothetical protein